MCSAWEHPGCPQGGWGSGCLLSLGHLTALTGNWPKKGNLLERGRGCWVCAGERISQGGQGGWGLQALLSALFSSTEGGIVIYYLPFFANRWKTLRLWICKGKDSGSRLCICPSSLGFFACLGKQQWSHSLLLEGNLCGVPTPAVEKDKNSPTHPPWTWWTDQRNANKIMAEKYSELCESCLLLILHLHF